jgi:hypothetical protein
MNKKMEFICSCKAFIARFRGKLSGNFEKQVIVIDNRKIVGARFTDCEIWYGGGGINLVDTHIQHCTFHLFGPANRTGIYLKCLDKLDPELIVKTFPGAIAHALKPSSM